MTQRTTWLVPEPSVIHECIEGEVLVVDLRRGAYFSLLDAAAAIWDGVVAGADAGAIAAWLATRFDAPSETLDAAVADFIAQLVAEGLVTATTAERGPVALPDHTGPRAPFQTPALARYRDIEEQLVVDPVHEVGDEGWPHLPTGT